MAHLTRGRATRDHSQVGSAAGGPLIRKAFKGVLVLNSDFDFARGQAAAAANRFAKDIALAVEG
jgi:hypothetical protein